ncbi:hypothetical protein KM043_013796 [Ampulex compressa]|nr:hypothetical protein KM043_013796 [Ampulex compressa]
MDQQQLEPCIDLPLQIQELEIVIDKARDWALAHGISMRSKESFRKCQVEILPFTLLPSSFPRKNFETAKNVQVLMNELVHKVAHDNSFLTNSLRSTVEADSFTAKLFDIYNIVYKEGFSQRISVGLLRSDYMLHEGFNNKIKQVELNTIASSFGSIATITSKYHKYMLSELGHRDKIKNIPENNALTGLSNGLVRAWTLYNNNEAVMLFVVENVTYNICDQRFIEFEIRSLNPEIKIVRKNLTELVSQAQLGPNKELFVKNEEVAVVYFRSGYQVEAYPTEHEWSVRLLIERSRAIKCPSIQYHLAGTKKIQQSLAQPGALNSFFTDSKLRKKVQEVFAGLYSLEFNEEGDRIIEEGVRQPNKFVLKPQREGGGNNVYNEDIKTRLSLMKDSKERTAWILMDRLYPPTQKNYIIHAGTESLSKETGAYQLSDVITELGIYGVIIGDQDNIILNEEVGHILRTKPSTENEGGIAAGIGALDSPYLIP